MKYSLFFLPVLILLAACGSDLCPPDEKVGELNLHADTKAWMPYDGTETLTFVKSTGEEITVTALTGKEATTDRACTKQICTEPAQFDPPTSCEYYDSEAIRFVFGNRVDFVADILYFSEVLRPDEEEFYQALRVSVSGDGLIGMGQLVTKTIPDQTFDYADLGLTEPFALQPSVTLNGETSMEVLKSEDDLLTIYFSKSEGLVGFENSEGVWNLKR